MLPVGSPSQSTRTALPGSQLVRDQWIAREEGRSVQTLVILVSWLFKSHANIEHISGNWNGWPVLLFADMNATEYASVQQYQIAKGVTTL